MLRTPLPLPEGAPQVWSDTDLDRAQTDFSSARRALLRWLCLYAGGLGAFHFATSVSHIARPEIIATDTVIKSVSPLRGLPL